MKSFTRWATVHLTLLVICVAFSDSATAQNDRPIKMSEVARLLDQGQTPQQVLEVMAQRGVDFRLSSAAVGRLERFGFTENQIELIRKIAAGEKVDLNQTPAEPGAAPPDAEGNAGEEGQAFKVGFPDPDHWHAAEKARIERAMKNAGLGYHRVELGRTTLYCSDSRARKLAPLLKGLETALIKHFPESISNASSPKSAHIVIVDGASEWRSWVNALMDSYEQDGMKFRFGPEEDPRNQLIEGAGFILPACAVAFADPRPDEESISRFATYALGHLMMARAGGKDHPNGLTTGFGDLAEEMAMGTPSVMIYSYEKRDLKQEGGWKGVVRALFKDRKIDSVTKPWGYETSTMTPEQYAECWSLVSTLSAAPDKFAEAVRFVREEGKPMPVAVRDAFGLEDRKLLEAWYKFMHR